MNLPEQRQRIRSSLNVLPTRILKVRIENGEKRAIRLKIREHPITRVLLGVTSSEDDEGVIPVKLNESEDFSW
jgi:hypothetical protein